MTPEQPSPRESAPGRDGGSPGGGHRHLSFLALDALKLGRLPEPPEREHLRVCGPCAQALQAVAPVEPLPAWLTDAGLRGSRPALAVPVAAVERGRRRWFIGGSLLSLAAAVSVAALLLVRPPPPEPAPVPEIRSKGAAPAVRVYVKRGDELWIWDGKTTIQPGDRLRLEIQSAGFGWVSVASLAGPGQAPAVLHEGQLDPSSGLLPVGFKVDGLGRRETISVILAQSRVPTVLHTREQTAAEAGTWRQVLTLDKEPTR